MKSRIKKTGFTILLTIGSFFVVNLALADSISTATSTYDYTCTATTVGGVITTTCDNPLLTQIGYFISFLTLLIIGYMVKWFVRYKKEKRNG